MSTETITNSFRPVKEYYDRLLEQETSPRLKLAAVDTFLMRFIAAALPHRKVIVDLASELTGGASRVFWEAQESMQFVKQATKRVEQASVMLAIDLENAGWQAQFEKVLETYPDALIYLLPIGQVGESLLLEVALAHCRKVGTHRLFLCREISPFLSQSQLALIHPCSDPTLIPVLTRIAQLYTGNFDYLSLLESHFSRQMERSPRLTESMPLLPREPLPEPPMPVQEGMPLLLSGGYLQVLYHRLVPDWMRLMLRSIRVSLLGR